MNSWSEIKKEWDIGDKFPVSPDRVLSAFSIIQQETGSRWFEEKKRTGLGKSLIVLEAVRFGEALAAARKVAADKLLRDLLLDWKSERFGIALSEADVIVKLLPSSDRIEYEQEIDGISKKPDLLQYVGSIQTQYEIFCPDISAEEKERNRNLQHLAQELGTVFKSGSLDVYLLKLDLDKDSKQAILVRVSQLNENSTYIESELPEVAFIVFDPKGGVTTEDEDREEKREIQENGKVIGGQLFDNVRDRSDFFRKRLNLKYRSPGLIVFSKSDTPNAFTNFKLLRLFRPALDTRAFQKVVHESSQLATSLPSVVVIEMGRPTVHVEDWADIVVEAFNSGSYTHPSAVWIRELHWGIDLCTWREILILNPYASIEIPGEIITSIVGEKKVMKIE